MNEYLNGMLLYETRGEAKFYYSYDTNGTLYSVKYTLTDSSELMTYYYTHNSRGDIVGIYNGNGELRAHYEYDAWGNVLSITDANGNAITDPNHVGKLNPFRYRGYYLDTETGFYYLMSRYYDPVTHRFVNSDGYFQAGSDILDTNMNAYCRNNPINFYDPTGTHSRSIKCGDPTCTVCRESRRIFINTHLDWYNKVTNSKILGVDCYGNFVYPTKNEYTTLDKIVDTIGAAIYSAEVNFDLGVGIGAKASLNNIVGFELLAKVMSISIDLKASEGYDLGAYTSISAGISIGSWDLTGYEYSEYQSFNTGIIETKSEVSNFLGVGASYYSGVGCSFNFGWNLDYFNKRLGEIW